MIPDDSPSSLLVLFLVVSGSLHQLLWIHQSDMFHRPTRPDWIAPLSLKEPPAAISPSTSYPSLFVFWFSQVLVDTEPRVVSEVLRRHSKASRGGGGGGGGRRGEGEGGTWWKYPGGEGSLEESWARNLPGASGSIP